MSEQGTDSQAEPSRAAASGSAGRRRRRPALLANEPRNQVSAVFARYRLLPVVLLVAVTVVGSVLAVGTVHVVVLLCIAPFALAAGAWAIARAGRGLGAVPPPAWIAFALSGYSVLQAVPIPAALLRAVSPVAAEIWVRALQPWGASSAWLSVSLDPGASVVEALKWFCYGSMFCAGAVVASGQSRRIVPGIVFGSAFLAALVALTNRLISADSLFGVYTPVLHSSFGITPLINLNNFAGYLNLGAFAGLGLLMSRRAVAPRWAIGLAVSVVIGLSAFCGSRAGLASLALGMLALITALWIFKLDGSRRLLWIPIGALVGGIALFLLAVNAGLWQSMIKEGAIKLALISWTKPVVRDFPLLGIGRGAFETVFPAYRADAGHHLYQFAENFVMQWCVEWGVPVALAALLGFAYTLRPAQIGARSEILALSCGIGVLVLLAQNLLDLALEVPSVTLALSALLGSGWAQRRERFDADAELGSRVPVATLFGAGVALWLVSAIVGSHPALDDRDAIASLAMLHEKGDIAASSKLGEALQHAIRRHPADPYFPLVAATVTRATSGEEMAFISRAIERDPMAGRPYLLLAQALAHRNAKLQALQAARLAVAREYGLVGPAVSVALSMTHDVDELKRTVPEGSAGVGTLVYLSRLGQLQAFHDSLLMEAIGRDPTAFEPRLLRADDLLNALEAKRDPCADARGAACIAELRSLIPVLARLDPRSDRPVVFSARLLLVEGDAAAAERLLANKCKTLEAQTACARLRFSIAEQLGDRAILQDAMASLLGDACATQSECASTATWLGQRLAANGDPVGALHMFERAAQESEAPQAWQQVADVANRLGLPSVAARAIRRAGGHADPASTDFTHTLEAQRVHDSPDPVSASGGH